MTADEYAEFGDSIAQGDDADDTRRAAYALIDDAEAARRTKGEAADFPENGDEDADDHDDEQIDDDDGDATVGEYLSALGLRGAGDGEPTRLKVWLNCVQVFDSEVPVSLAALVRDVTPTAGRRRGCRGCGPGEYTIEIYGRNAGGRCGTLRRRKFAVTDEQAADMGWDDDAVDPDLESDLPQTDAADDDQPSMREIMMALVAGQRDIAAALAAGAAGGSSDDSVIQSMAMKHLGKMLDRAAQPPPSIIERAAEVGRVAKMIEDGLATSSGQKLVSGARTALGMLQGGGGEDGGSIGKIVDTVSNLGKEAIEAWREKNAADGSASGLDVLIPGLRNNGAS